jgi:RNA polymerase sigma-70 factor (ECF subfamily)
MVLRHRRGGVLQDVRTLFDSGTTIGLTDGELLGRFADRPERDEAAEPAFAALVDRHGPMVLRVCRSILRDKHDAQDALQATFLVLVRRAGAVRRQQSVGSWLHGVALRVAAHARADLARRRRHERCAGQARSAADRCDTGGISPEVAAILHEELGRLPERYRAAVVLCYLEGHTCEAAADRLGWPVGTVKSRLARGRGRLRDRLIRRGLAPDEASGSPTAPVVVVPAALAQTTVEAMLRFAAGRSTAGAISATALSWTHQTLRTMQMARLAFISSLLIAGLAATGAARLAAQQRAPIPTRPTEPAKMAARTHEPVDPPPTAKAVEIVTVRVVDLHGQAVPDVEVEVLEHGFDHEGLRYRTGADGRVRIPVDPHADPSYGTRFLSRPDVRTIGWAFLPRLQERKDKDSDSIPLVLLPRTHTVEGSVVNKSGNPIPGVRIRAVFVEQETNRAMFDFEFSLQDSLLGSAMTDEAGRFTLNLPDQARVSLVGLHARYAGPRIECRPDERTLAPITLEDAGGIEGTVVDGATGRPVEGAKLGANGIEFDGVNLIRSGWAMTDARGHFRMGGLPPGVYNLCLYSSPRGKRFTAQAIEGVRVKAGEDAPADLKLVEGRSIHGTVVDVKTGKPRGRVPIFCSNSALPGSGHAGEAAYTDDQGRFEFFAPPGLACVYLDTSTQGMNSPHRDKGPYTRTLIVAAGRDLDPVGLHEGHDPTDQSLRRVFTPGYPTQVRVRAEAPREAPKDAIRTSTGRIFDQDGSPIAGVQVTYNHDGRTMTYATDRLGVFRAKGLLPEKLLIRVSKKGYRPASALIPPAAWEVDITLPQLPVSSY